MAQTHKCLIVLTAPEGTGMISGSACCATHGKEPDSRGREWTSRSSSHTGMEPWGVGRGWGWGGLYLCLPRCRA